MKTRKSLVFISLLILLILFQLFSLKFIRIEVGDYYYNRMEYDNASNWYGKVLRKELLKVNQYLSDGCTHEAVDLLKNIPERWRHLCVSLSLIEAYIATGQTEEAEQMLPNLRLNTDTLVNVAHRFHDKGLIRYSDILAKMADAQGGGSIATRRWLGLWNAWQGHSDRALTYWEAIIHETPNDHHAWSLLALNHYGAHRYEKAVDAASRALALMPNNATYQFWLAKVLLARNAIGDREKAIEMLKNVIKTNPDFSPEPWAELGWAYYSIGDGIEAVPYFEQAANLGPQNVTYRLRLAQALLGRGQGGDREKAIAILKQVKKENPNLTEAARTLQQIKGGS
jgi:tetratricopeptide (TPR) repeat protein